MKRLSVALALLLALGMAAPAAGQSEWCLANLANCVGSDTYQSTAYAKVDGGSSNYGAFLGNTTGSKPLHWADMVAAGTPVSISHNFGAGSTFASMYQISTDAAIIALLPNRDSAKVQRFLRFAADNNNQTVRFGEAQLNLTSLASRRVELQWYSYHSPNYQWAFEGSCTNGKIAHNSNGFYIFPALLTLTITNGSTSMYTVQDNTGNAQFDGWTWPGRGTAFHCCNAGSGPHVGSGVNVSTYRGNWTRHSIVVENPRTADAQVNGYNLRYYVKNVTAGTPEVEDLRFSNTCAGCLDAAFGGGTWTYANQYPRQDMRSLHTEFYRSGSCNGWQGWVYVDFASWTTNAGQRIGAAREVEGGTGAPPASTEALQGLYNLTGADATTTRLPGPTQIGFIHTAAVLTGLVVLLLTTWFLLAMLWRRIHAQR